MVRLIEMVSYDREMVSYGREMVSYGREMASYGREMRVILGDICDERTKYQSTILYRGAPTKIIHALDS